MLLLEPLWRPDGTCSALLAHLPAAELPRLASALEETPLFGAPCYWPAPSGSLPPGLPAIHSLEAVGPAGCDAPDTRRCLVPFGAPLPEQPFILTGLGDPGQLSTLQGRDALVCGPWITAPLPRATPNPAQPVLLELLGLIVRDAEVAELERIFAKAPQLTINLLRLVNSVAMGSHRHTESLRQAIALLGRRQLQRWLQLLLYAEQYGAEAALPPLFTAAALRAKRMESWALAGWLPGLSPDTAFLAGMLSLMDRLFGMPLAEVLASLPLPKGLQDGLLRGTGEVGEALECMVSCEAGNVQALGERMIDRIDSHEHWMDCEVDAVSWALALHGKVGR